MKIELVLFLLFCLGWSTRAAHRAKTNTTNSEKVVKKAKRKKSLIGNGTALMAEIVDFTSRLFPRGPVEMPRHLRVLSNEDKHPPYKTSLLKYQWYPVACNTTGMAFRRNRTLLDDESTKVWLMTEVHSEKNYVWKRYKVVAHFFVEVAFFTIVKHKRVLKPTCILFDRFGNQGLVMDFVIGQTTQKYFQQFNVTTRMDHVLRIAAQVYDVYKYIHWLGFVHGDVKPDNVMVDTEGNAVVIDFGYSLPYPYFKHQGTPLAIAPEVKEVIPGPIRENCDWWSFGSTIAQWAAPMRDKLTDERYSPLRISKGTYEMGKVPEFFPEPICELVFYFMNPDPYLRLFNTKQQLRWLDKLEGWRNVDFRSWNLEWDPTEGYY